MAQILALESSKPRVAVATATGAEGGRGSREDHHPRAGQQAMDKETTSPTWLENI